MKKPHCDKCDAVIEGGILPVQSTKGYEIGEFEVFIAFDKAGADDIDLCSDCARGLVYLCWEKMKLKEEE